tara:strand:- start:2039 stop:2596 length:558 start_codon:yes stop_codon:yes gene_type:complete
MSELIEQSIYQQSLQSGFRFLLRIQDVPFALVSDVGRPSPVFDNPRQFQLLNWKFKFPGGIVTWQDISFTIRETFDNGIVDSISGIMLDKYKKLSYDNPNQVSATNLKNMSKSSLMQSLGDVIIQLINPEGNVYEQWTLYGAFVSGITFSKLSYKSDGLIGTTMKISYDWAALTYVNENGFEKTY